MVSAVAVEAVHCIILANITHIIINKDHSNNSEHNYTHCFLSESCVNDSYCIPDNSGRHCDLCHDFKDKGHAVVLDKEDLEDIGETVCPTCFFPQNCIGLEKCRHGTSGRNCELCGAMSGDNKGYHLVGNLCTKCPVFPWSFLGLLGFVGLLSSSLYINGFSKSIYTKLKILLDFFQFLMLSFHIKVYWSDAMTNLGEIMKFASFNTNVIIVDCLLSGKVFHHYLEWFSSILIPTIALFVGIYLNKQEKKPGSESENADDEIQLAANEPQSADKTTENETTKEMSDLKRLKINHAIYFIMLAYYVPITLSAIHSLSCTSYFGKEIAAQITQSKTCFLYDLTEDCKDFLFQTLQFLLVILFVMFVLPFPIGILAFTVRQLKWNLLEQSSPKYGYVFDSYTNGFCFWEMIILLRKVISIILTDTAVTNPVMQATALLSITGLYLLVMLIGQPFRPCHWKKLIPKLNNHLLLEVLSCLSLIMMQSLALVNATIGNKKAMEIVAFLFVSIFLITWLVLVILLRIESTDQEHDTRSVWHYIIKLKPMRMPSIIEQKPVKTKNDKNCNKPLISVACANRSAVNDDDHMNDLIQKEDLFESRIVEEKPVELQIMDYSKPQIKKSRELQKNAGKATGLKLNEKKVNVEQSKKPESTEPSNRSKVIKEPSSTSQHSKQTHAEQISKKPKSTEQKSKLKPDEQSKPTEHKPKSIDEKSAKSSEPTPATSEPTDQTSKPKRVKQTSKTKTD